ncbi:hypothetical protein J7J18_04695 [bacterium]|nr:hypothetical protein [bacterium]
MKKEYLEWVARKQGLSRVVDILAQHHYPEDLDTIDDLRDIAIQQVKEGTYSAYEKEIMIDEIRKGFRDYKDILKLKYLDVV